MDSLNNSSNVGDGFWVNCEPINKLQTNYMIEDTDLEGQHILIPLCFSATYKLLEQKMVYAAPHVII